MPRADRQQPPPANPPTVLAILDATYPQAHCALHFATPFQLLVATILSAQCTDAQVNRVTPELFRRFPDAFALARAPLAEVETVVRATGFYRSKARHLLGMAGALVERFNGTVPATLADLLQLPGVGRKTANVVLGTAFGLPGMVVDTHVRRVAGRLGWTSHGDPVKIEADLCVLLPEAQWNRAGHLLIWHGRALCKAPVPTCSRCPLLPLCPQRGVGRQR